MADIQRTPATERKPGAATCFQLDRAAVAAAAVGPTKSPTCQLATDPASAKYNVSRFDACYDVPATVKKIDTVTQQELGHINFELILLAKTVVDSPNWTHEVTMHVTEVTPGLEGTTVIGNALCSGECTPTGPNTFGPRTLLPTDVNYAAGYTAPNTSSGAINNGTSKWTFAFVVPGATITPPVDNPPTPTIRCDNATPGRSLTGCVVPSFVPFVTYKLSGPYPELATHIGLAQLTGLPGAYPNGPVLTRLLSGDDSKDNRTTACPGRYTRPAGKSCDEYPFASSNEGAASPGSAARGRTFQPCQIPDLPQNVTGAPGYSACMINAQQNSAGGTQLNNMYLANRVISNDQYRVQITN